MIGAYEYIPHKCSRCGSSARLHTAFGLFWYECDNWKCERNRHIPRTTYQNANDAFYAWNKEQEGQR